MINSLSLERNHFLLALIPWVPLLLTGVIGQTSWAKAQGAGLLGLGLLAGIVFYALLLIVVVIVGMRKGTSYTVRVLVAFAILWVVISILPNVFSALMGVLG